MRLGGRHSYGNAFSQSLSILTDELRVSKVVNIIRFFIYKSGSWGTKIHNILNLSLQSYLIYNWHFPKSASLSWHEFHQVFIYSCVKIKTDSAIHIHRTWLNPVLCIYNMYKATYRMINLVSWYPAALQWLISWQVTNQILILFHLCWASYNHFRWYTKVHWGQMTHIWVIKLGHYWFK